MTPERSPLILHFWLLGTWLLSYPITVLSKYLHRRMGADPRRFQERLGKSGPDSTGKVIWFHAASLGEVSQIGALAAELVQKNGTEMLVTTTTPAGAEWVAKTMPYAHHRFAPIETPSAVRQFLGSWQISVAIFIEGDLWPRLVRGTYAQGIPQVLLNARHSRTRLRFATVFSSLLSSFHLVTCRSLTIADDVRGLGLREDQVHVLPDLRLTLPRLATDLAQIEPLKNAVGHRPLWLAASTHPADEKTVLTAHKEVFLASPETLLIIAPRHPKRAEHLRKMAHELGLKTAQRSLGEDITAGTQVYLADTLGELGVLYTLCPIAFLGGSFGSEGGHNPYEPVSFNTALLYGPNVKNFSDAYAALAQDGAALQIQEPAQLGAVVVKLMQTGRAGKMAEAGAEFMNDTQDCLSDYVTLVQSVLESSQR